MKKGCVYIFLALFVFLFGNFVYAEELNSKVCPNILDMGQKFSFYDEARSPYSSISSVTWSPGSSPHFNLPEGPVVLQKKFLGWFTESGKQVTNENAGTIKGLSIYDDGCHIGYEEVKLYAKYETIHCTTEVKDYQKFYFNFNGGTYEEKDELVVLYRLSDSSNKIDVLPVKEGYKFDGWYLEDDFKTKVTEYYMNDKKDECGGYIEIELYAKWVKEGESSHICAPITGGGFTLYFETNGGSQIDKTTVCVGCAPSDTLLPVPVKEGYDFTGWYKNKELTAKFSGDKISDVSSTPKYDEYTCQVGYNDVTLYAGWQEKSHAVAPPSEEKPDENEPNSPNQSDTSKNEGSSKPSSSGDPKNPDTGEGIGMILFTCISLGVVAIGSTLGLRKFKMIRKI